MPPQSSEANMSSQATLIPFILGDVYTGCICDYLSSRSLILAWNAQLGLFLVPRPAVCGLPTSLNSVGLARLVIVVARHASWKPRRFLAVDSAARQLRPVSSDDEE